MAGAPKDHPTVQQTPTVAANPKPIATPQAVVSQTFVATKSAVVTTQEVIKTTAEIVKTTAAAVLTTVAHTPDLGNSVTKHGPENAAPVQVSPGQGVRTAPIITGTAGPKITQGSKKFLH